MIGRALACAAAVLLAAASTALSSPEVARSGLDEPKWSPDGKWLAFRLDRSDWSSSLQVIRRDGTRRHAVHRFHSNGFARLEWSPDSRRLAVYDSSTATTEIRRIDGSFVRRFDGAVRDWSPGGGRIVLVRGTPPVVYVGNVSSGALRPLGQGTGPAWSPDGKLIAFSALAGETPERCWPSRRIFVVGADGRGLRQVSPDNDSARPGGHGGSAWSPDSKRVAYGDHPTCVHIEAEVDAFTVPATGTRRAIRLGVGSPAWSPNGHFLSLEKRFDTDPRLTIVTARGVMRFESYCGEDARWSPKGGRVAFSEGSTARSCDPDAIYVAEANGSGRRRLALGRRPTWSRGLIAFIRETDFCGDRIFVIAPNGRGLRALTPCLAS